MIIRRSILTALVLFTALVAPSTAGAAIVHAEAGAGASGHKLLWVLDYETVDKTVTLNVTHTRFDGTAAIGAPQQADLVVIRPNGQEQTFNLMTLAGGQNPALGVLNEGPQTFSVPGGLRVSANRSNLIAFRTDYVPPLGA